MQENFNLLCSKNIFKYDFAENCELLICLIFFF